MSTEKNPKDPQTKTILPKDNDFPMPASYMTSFGATVKDFSFKFNNTTRRLEVALEPETNLLNLENNVLKATHFLTTDYFYSHQKEITEAIDEYNKLLQKYFVNESYFLYDKSNLIKDTHITAINKNLSIYGSLSYFQGQSTNESLQLLDVTNFLKFFIEKNSLKNELKFQLTKISGNIPKTKDNKVHHFSITHLGKKRKLRMSEPIETVIICAQQNFEVAGSLNPVQIELENNRILNRLKKYKNVLYRIVPLAILFPATIENNTKQIFVTSRELNDVKKSLIKCQHTWSISNNRSRQNKQLKQNKRTISMDKCCI